MVFQIQQYFHFSMTHTVNNADGMNYLPLKNSFVYTWKLFTNGGLNENSQNVEKFSIEIRDFFAISEGSQ